MLRIYIYTSFESARVILVSTAKYNKSVNLEMYFYYSRLDIMIEMMYNIKLTF